MTIKIITEPSVYLVGRQEVGNEGMTRFLADHDIPNWATDTKVAGEELCEVAGRLCYMSFAKPRPGGNKAYLQHILEVGHGSVTEHSSFNFIITGVSRSFTHELVRHRVGFSYSQLSQRYVDESDVAFVMPPLIVDMIDWDNVPDPASGEEDEPLEEVDEIWSGWMATVEACRTEYESLSDSLATGTLMRELPSSTWHDGEAPESFVELNDAIAKLPAERRTAIRKQAREAARSVLPNCTETKIFVTANVRALRHFIEMRSDPGADAEMRRVAIAILKLMQTEAPNLFDDYKIEDDGTATTPYRKV